MKIERNNDTAYQRMLFRVAIRLRHSTKHLRFFIKWIFYGLIIGILCGLAGTAFHYALSFAASSFAAHPQLLYALPFSGLLIVFSYRALKIYNDQGTNSILRAARAEDTSALRVAPLIFLATFLTHVCGGSAGREGAALQIGGSIGSFISRKLKLSIFDQQLMVMCGMSATFCALFCYSSCGCVPFYRGRGRRNCILCRARAVCACVIYSDAGIAQLGRNSSHNRNCGSSACRAAHTRKDTCACCSDSPARHNILLCHAQHALSASEAHT